jgi:LacI family transcriptional regulator
MDHITLKEAANQLHLSRITVSKVLNNKPGVSLETKKKVLRKLAENGYDKLTPEQLQLAGKITERRARCIAVVTIAPEFSEFWLKIINAISTSLAGTDYDFIYSILTKNEEGNYTIPKIIDQRHVSGIIVINVYDDEIIHSLLDMGIPVSFLDTTPSMFREDAGGDLLLLDGFNSIKQITEHMIEKGLTEFGFIGDITYAKTMLDRWEGFQAALAAHGLPLQQKYCFTSCPGGHFYYPEEISAVLDGLSSLPQAFVCANDYIAFMLIDKLKKRGCRVPEDISISGYDNIRENLTAESRLTTVCVDTEILGRRLVKQILMRIGIPDLPRETIFIQPKIIYRDSTNQ